MARIIGNSIIISNWLIVLKDANHSFSPSLIFLINEILQSYIARYAYAMEMMQCPAADCCWVKDPFLQFQSEHSLACCGMQTGQVTKLPIGTFSWEKCAVADGGLPIV